MIVVNGIERKRMEPADFAFVSAAHDKIVLPYLGDHWGELSLEFMNLAYLHCFPGCEGKSVGVYYDQIIQNATFGIAFNIQRHLVRLTAHVHINASSGISTDGRVFLVADKDEIVPVLDQFFSSGGLGIDKAYLSHFTNNYERWRSG